MPALMPGTKPTHHRICPAQPGAAWILRYPQHAVIVAHYPDPGTSEGAETIVRSFADGACPAHLSQAFDGCTFPQGVPAFLVAERWLARAGFEKARA